MEDALKFFFGGKLFYRPPSETPPEWKSPFMMYIKESLDIK